MSVSMSRHYTHNHYVPVWYQKRFLPFGQSRFVYHDLHPQVNSQGGRTWQRSDRLNWGPTRCFAQNDLYTVRWGAINNTDVERLFFGEIDATGRDAVAFFDDFEIRDGVREAHPALIRYMSTQKLRTPKGLGFLRQASRISSQYALMHSLQRHQIIYGTLWSEAVWQIADASESKTKFIVSDHPVTVYNRRCFPGSRHCTGFNDPDIRSVATHTVFPLSLNKVLILTNLSWVRNPYQDELRFRPNPSFYHPTMRMLTDIQQGRMLAEHEVRQINYIIKKRALRWVAAANEDWLHPERHLSSTHWNAFGDGYLLMPEPRAIHMGGEMFVGYEDGSSEAFGEYGHRPWENGFKDDARYRRESAALRRFQGEFARLQGPDWRGWPYDFNGKDGHRDSDDYHRHLITSAPPDGRHTRRGGSKLRT
jgi:hypothetical protein